MSVKRLKVVSGEVIETRAPSGEESKDRVVRRAVLVHAGPGGETVSLESSDGPIVFDDDRIQAVVDSQNDLIDKLAEHYGSFEKIPVGAFPPILDQHEEDSMDRVIGRLTGRLTFQKRAVPKVGDDVACALSDITWLGSGTVERVADGRIFHLSIRIDEDTNTLTEVSAVIDPAAPGAMILKKGEKRMAGFKDSGKYKDCTIRTGEGTNGKIAFQVFKQGEGFIDGSNSGPKFDDEGAAVEAAKRWIDQKRLSKETIMDPKKLKAAADRKKKLSAAAADLKKLSAKLVTTRDEAKLAHSAATVTKRLSAVVKSGKMTPAEFKKVDVKRLAALAPEAMDLVVGAFESREVQVPLGQRGTSSALEFSQVGEQLEKKQTKKLKSEIRGDFKRLGLKMKSSDESEAKPALKKLEGMESETVDKKLEGESTSELPSDQTAETGAMAGRIDELETTIARIAGVVSDLVDDMKQEDAEEDSELAADPEKKKGEVLEDGDKNDDDKELAGSESDDAESDEDETDKK